MDNPSRSAASTSVIACSVSFIFSLPLPLVAKYLVSAKVPAASFVCNAHLAEGPDSQSSGPQLRLGVCASQRIFDSIRDSPYRQRAVIPLVDYETT
jgi:hypothetical protein